MRLWYYLGVAILYLFLNFLTKKTSRKSAPFRRVCPSINIFDPQVLEEAFFAIAKAENENFGGLNRDYKTVGSENHEKNEEDLNEERSSEDEEEESIEVRARRESFARGSLLLSYSRRSVAFRKSAYLPCSPLRYSYIQRSSVG